MKKLFTIAVAITVFTACQQKTAQQTEANTAQTTDAIEVLPVAEAPKMIFTQETYQFGEIVQGEKVNFDFKFKNTGKTPLIITNATATCGCTVPDYPKTPIGPGQEGVIKVVFNSEGKMGMQDKVVTISSNANPAAHQLHLTGEVKEKK